MQWFHFSTSSFSPSLRGGSNSLVGTSPFACVFSSILRMSGPPYPFEIVMNAVELSICRSRRIVAPSASTSCSGYILGRHHKVDFNFRIVGPRHFLLSTCYIGAAGAVAVFVSRAAFAVRARDCCKDITWLSALPSGEVAHVTTGRTEVLVPRTFKHSQSAYAAGGGRAKLIDAVLNVLNSPYHCNNLFMRSTLLSQLLSTTLSTVNHYSKSNKMRLVQAASRVKRDIRGQLRFKRCRTYTASSPGLEFFSKWDLP